MRSYPICLPSQRLRDLRSLFGCCSNQKMVHHVDKRLRNGFGVVTRVSDTSLADKRTNSNISGTIYDYAYSYPSAVFGAIFQQHNDMPHMARVSQDCLLTVTTLPWPARSPDLSPIENIWDHLGWRVWHPISLNELETSDEEHFWLNGYVNKQNCRIWSEANPQVYVETPLHPEKLTVWCALWAGGIIGPYFFKNDEGHNVTVNGDRYRAMITNFLIPELNNHDVQELWFQQDGATCHTARATIYLLKGTFGDRLISRFGPVNWLPRSCDLTPLDYFLWGYVKS
ncbi:putative transposable element [Trichonephila clavipes]|nr:putative transposable element [Trichonephila clavipes]